MPAKTCERCGIEFHARRSTIKCCSRRCSHALQALAFKGAGSPLFRGGPAVFNCRVCGAVVTRYMGPGSKPPIYCGRACMTLDYKRRFSSQGNPAWRGGKWPYKGRAWDDIAAAIIVRDGACVYCGTVVNLQAHHLIPQRFWLDLDASNVPSNLVACCIACHPKRPEHYWFALPDSVFDAALHSRTAVQRVVSVRAKPLCVVCGKPVTWARNKCCSVACANTLKWQRGIFDRNRGLKPTTAARNSRVCPQCGTTFILGRNIYCSRACFLAAPKDAPGKRNGRVKIKACPVCDTRFIHYARTYCSRSCANRARAPRQRQQVTADV